MKFSNRFERDYNWYLSVSDIFSFDGVKNYIDKRGDSLIVESDDGRTAKECFYIYDSQGRIVPTCEPEELKKLYRTKGSVNLHIKMYAEDRAGGILPLIEFEEMCKEFNAPSWFYDAVENQKYKHYKKLFDLK